MRYDLNEVAVSEELRKLSGLTWGTLIYRGKKFVKVELRAEKIDFSRAEVFISDLNEITRGAFSVLNTELLVFILYDDFLTTVRENMSMEKTDHRSVTLDELVSDLLMKREMYFPRNKQELYDNFSSRKRWTVLDIDLRREAALRGEVFLNDAETARPDFQMSLAELVSILFAEFVHQLRKGNQRALVNALLDRFYSHDFN